MDTKARVETQVPQIEAILDRVEASADPQRSEAVKSFARELLCRAEPDFLAGRSDGDVKRLVGSTFDLLQQTKPEEIGVRVYQHPEHGHLAAVEAVISDRPFVVDTLRQYLTSKGFEIRHFIHPVVVVDRDKRGVIKQVSDWRGKGRRISATYGEFEGHIDSTNLKVLEDELRVCLDDVKLATDDFSVMLEKTDAVARELGEYAARFPDRKADIDEVVGFLEWLRDGGFIYLGYREYAFTPDGDGRLFASLVRGSGLGILRREEESAMWEPTPVDQMPAELRARALQGPMLMVSKANSESHVHRRARMDYVGLKKLDDSGNVVGEFRFLGLFTWKAYSEPKWDIPILRHKLRAVLERANVPEGSHDYKAILALFNDMPLEELFQVDVDDLSKQIFTVMAAEDTGDVRLVLTPDVLGRGVNVMVILPKRNYTDEVRGRLRSEISHALGGTVLADHLSIGAGDTARLHFYVSSTPGRAESIDVGELRKLVGSIVRTWKQRLHDALEEHYDGATVHHLERAYFDSFSPGYVATVEVGTAVEDIERLEALERTGLMQVALADHGNGAVDASAVRLFVRRGSMILADIMPMLEHLGLRVIEADAMEVGSGTSAATIHTFVVQGPDSRRLDRAADGDRLTTALGAVAVGATDSDRFNQLVITAGLTWREVAVLRAYSEYAFQIDAVASRRAVPDALTAHPRCARLLIETFKAKFDPAQDGGRAAEVEACGSRFRESLQAVESIIDDLTLRRLHNLINATVRTSYFRNMKRDLKWPRTTFKFDCAAIEHMPYPRPAREMFVHGPRTAGLHLRFGPVARGGLRWSERPDDFRTEVLGLVKTQQVKNTVIVPSGAKGAFYLRRRPAGRTEVEPAVRESYEGFIGGLLDVTDNIVDGAVVRPPDTVIYDDEDPYLVVAADKGTATYSDLANSIAIEYGFWMDDAFASGGSHGYDHKKEKITARGAWECVRHHFREMGIDPNADPITVVGIGDMSGDVFGNGMLLSRTIKLIAAFDHRHIFIDPEPDMEKSFGERQRLFDLPRSSWDDYDRGALGPGGGVYPRGAKEIRLSDQARKLFGIEEAAVNGQALIKAILKTPADLLWNGGIGTYVKATDETQAEVGDSSNDAVRIDANELRVQVVGEGGNLGLTQRARIEYALQGGRLNTDAIDNSGGVDMSDHEVNLKIMLRKLVDRGEMGEEERNELLESVTDDVAESVLANNRSQGRALSLEQLRAQTRLADFRDASYYLEQRAGLRRALEHIPGWGRLQTRKEAGQSLTRPELAVLLAYSKMHLKREMIASTLPDDPALMRCLIRYFPAEIVERVGREDLLTHRLAREIAATVLTNRLVDLMGSTFIPRIVRDTGASPAAAARGWYVASEIMGASELLERIEVAEKRLATEEEYSWLLTLEGILDRTVRWAIENLAEDAEVGGVIEEFRGPVAELCDILPSIAHGSQKSAIEGALEELTSDGVPGPIAMRVAALQFLEDLMEVTRISRQVDRPVSDVGRVYFIIGDEFDFGLLLELLKLTPGEDEWEQRAAQGLVQDLGQARRNLTLAALATREDGPLDDSIAEFRAGHAARLAAMREILEELLTSENINLAALTVATRETVRQSALVLEGRG